MEQLPGKAQERPGKGTSFLTMDTSGIVSRSIPGDRALWVLPQSFSKLPEDPDDLQLLEAPVILEINILVSIQPPAQRQPRRQNTGRPIRYSLTSGLSITTSAVQLSGRMSRFWLLVGPVAKNTCPTQSSAVSQVKSAPSPLGGDWKAVEGRNHLFP